MTGLEAVRAMFRKVDAEVAEAGRKSEKAMNVTELWKIANAAETLSELQAAEKAVREADISNDDFDELMMAITYKYREAYRRQR